MNTCTACVAGSLLRAEGIGETCQSCGVRYSTVYWLPDDVWEKITPKPNQSGAGLLCITCAEWKARKLGIELRFVAERL